MLRAQLVAAFMLLTRLPVARLAGPNPPDLARSVWAFPIVGLVVNGLAALVYWAAHRLGMPPVPAAAWAIAASMVTTGALHEDGLADTVDGFGGGSTPERKLAIMRDSRIGTFGALALMLSTILRIGVIATLDRPGPVAAALIAAGMLGRGAIIVVLLALEPARSDGMGASVTTPPRAAAAVGFVIAALGAFVLAPYPIVVAAAALVACFGIVRLANRQIGGATGDVMGAAELTVECVALSTIACFTAG